MDEENVSKAVAILGGRYLGTRTEYTAQAVMPGGHTLLASGSNPEDARALLLRKVADFNKPKPRGQETIK